MPDPSLIDDLYEQFRKLSDSDLLAELRALAPLEDGDHPAWRDDLYWEQSGYRFVALAQAAADRKLVEAIPLLLERICYGDPGEMMRGIRHALEFIVKPDWSRLVDLLLPLAQSPRLGTRLWAIDELAVLRDARAEPIFRGALSDPEEIAWRAERGLEWLAAERVA